MGYNNVKHWLGDVDDPIFECRRRGHHALTSGVHCSMAGDNQWALLRLHCRCHSSSRNIATQIKLLVRTLIGLVTHRLRLSQQTGASSGGISKESVRRQSFPQHRQGLSTLGVEISVVQGARRSGGTFWAAVDSRDVLHYWSRSTVSFKGALPVALLWDEPGNT